MPNIALAKIEKYYKDKGYGITTENFSNNNLFRNTYEKVFVSCVFEPNKEKAISYQGENTMIGGPGVDLITKLPKEVYDIRPRINYDFATRGCHRNCGWCLVHRKEGNIVKIERDLYDVWDSKAYYVTFLDNNILAQPEHFKLLCNQSRKHRLALDFNQGLDFRLITDEIAYYITKRVKFKMGFPRLALDTPDLIPIFNEKLKLLRKYARPKFTPFVYVLCGFNTTFEEDLERLNVIRDNKCQAFLMYWNQIRPTPEHTNLKGWANQFGMFRHFSFSQYLTVKGKKNNFNQLSLIR